MPMPLPPPSQAPSKWDDAQRWIGTPTMRRSGSVRCGRRRCPCDGVQGAHRRASVGSGTHPSAGDGGRMHLTVDLNSDAPTSVDLKQNKLVSSHKNAARVATLPTVKTVFMRDIGTGMSPDASTKLLPGSSARTMVQLNGSVISQLSSERITSFSKAVYGTNSCLQKPCRKDNDVEVGQKKAGQKGLTLGTPFDKMNVAAWIRKEEEDYGSLSQKIAPTDLPAKDAIDVQARTWEEAKKAKLLARYKWEEERIQVWENRQKAKAEAEMKKIEIYLERMRAKAIKKLTCKLAAAKEKVEKKRSAAVAEKNRQVAKAVKQEDYFQRTGRISSSFPLWLWCV